MILSGRLGRFAHILEDDVGSSVSETVLKDTDRYSTFNNADKAAWWRDAMRRLETQTDMEKAAEIMEKCGRKCCGPTHRKQARQLSILFGFFNKAILSHRS